MSSGNTPRIGSVSPTEAWDLLQQDSSVLLIDVRTSAEWSFVGLPDLSSLGRETICVSWQEWPDMSKNPGFAETVAEKIEGRSPTALLFLCRSGVRSKHAAELMLAGYLADGVDVGCINIETGFEGDLDAERHRGGLNGWKQAGLPWRQA